MKVTWICYLHNHTSMGVIAINVIKELTKLGVDVGLKVLNDDVNPQDYPPEVQEAIKKGHRENSIGIFFAYPDIYGQVRCKINVGYTGADSSGWYSTACDKTPPQICNEFMDYMLTPSNYSKEIMQKCGVTKPIYVFPHGVDFNLFTPIKREYTTPFTFLYTGELSERKGTQDLIRTFLSVFGDDAKYRLVLRANTHMQYYGGEEIHNLCKDHKNIKLYWKNEGQEEIKNYFYDAQAYVYPSKADWYGMTPFESVASGLPTIVTASNGYYEFLKNYTVDIGFEEEEIGNKHPYLQGKWNKPNLKELEDVLKKVSNKNNYENIAQWSYNNTKEIQETFSWEAVTKNYLIPFLKKVEKEEAEKMNYRVTIGIPTKDRPVELSLLLQSLLFQTYDDYEILIVDDCHTNILYENTTIQSLFKLHKELGHTVTLVKGERKGPHIGGQKILENSKTELILRLDDDVSLRPSFIEDLVNQFKKDPEIGACGPIYLNPHEPLSTQLIGPNISQEFMKEQGKVFWTQHGELFLTGWLQVNLHPTEEPLEVEHLNSGFLYKKSAGLKIGGYCLDLSPVGHREESDFSYRIFKEGYKLYIVPTALAWHFHPMNGGIRETKGEMLKKENWDHDEKIFLERMKKILPKNEKLEDDKFISVVVLTHGNNENLKTLVDDINRYTNHPHELIIINNDVKPLAFHEEIKHHNARIFTTSAELSVSTARNMGVEESSPKSKFICFIDDDARITGRYNQTTDWLDYLYNRFHEQPDVGAVGPIYTWFDELKTNTLSVACLFTSKKVWDIVGGFDHVFGNKEKGTWGYEDVDWSYRVVSRGFKLLGVADNYFPFYHEDTTDKPKSGERILALIKGLEVLREKYDLTKINKLTRTTYPFTKDQMEIPPLETKLNIGCYHMLIPGFTNIDIQPDIGADLVCDVRNIQSKFQPNSVALILMAQCLEHITFEDAKSVMKSLYNILKPNGCLIIEVPECDDLEEKFKNGQIDQMSYDTLKHGCTTEPHQEHFHCYTRETLSNLFIEAGFKWVTEMDNKEYTTNGELAIRMDGVK